MIVVLFDENDNLTDFYNFKYINIYKKEDDEFKIMKEITNKIADTSSIDALRRFLKELILEFGESKVVIGSNITGIPFLLLVDYGYEICEAKIFNETLLSQIHEDYIKATNINPTLDPEAELIRVEAAKTPIEPFAVDEDGNFFLDLIKTQKYRPEISSKKALLPFLSYELFQSLTILCSHVMPWLSNYFKENTLMEYSTKREDGKYIIIISHKACGD